MADLKETSRKAFPLSGLPSNDDIQTGCLQRIADATESMAQRHIQLMADVEYYKGQSKANWELCKAKDRQNSALRGVITRMKREKANGR